MRLLAARSSRAARVIPGFSMFGLLALVALRAVLDRKVYRRNLQRLHT
jgi:hypothetical protein